MKIDLKFNRLGFAAQQSGALKATPLAVSKRILAAKKYVAPQLMCVSLPGHAGEQWRRRSSCDRSQTR